MTRASARLPWRPANRAARAALPLRSPPVVRAPKPLHQRGAYWAEHGARAHSRSRPAVPPSIRAARSARAPTARRAPSVSRWPGRAHRPRALPPRSPSADRHLTPRDPWSSSAAASGRRRAATPPRSRPGGLRLRPRASTASCAVPAEPARRAPRARPTVAPWCPSPPRAASSRLRFRRRSCATPRARAPRAKPARARDGSCRHPRVRAERARADAECPTRGRQASSKTARSALHDRAGAARGARRRSHDREYDRAPGAAPRPRPVDLPRAARSASRSSD